MRFKCPKCETDMDLQETAHVCPECSHEVSLDEASDLFDDGKLVGIIDEDEVEEIVESVEDKEEILVTDISEDIAALVEGEELSEAFVEKAKTIFEAAVTSRVKAEKVALDEAYEAKLVDAKEELVEKVDGYLDHVVSEWMEDNEIAIEEGLKADMNESFAEGIADLLKEHYIQAPEERWDIVEGLADKVESLEAKLDEEMESSMTAKKEVFEAEKAIAFVQMTESMADTQKEKLLDLAESVEADDIEEYVSKVNTLKESYFNPESGSSHKLDEDTGAVDETETDIVSADQMAEAIRLLNKKS